MTEEHGKPDDLAFAAWLDGELDEDGATRMAKLVASDDSLGLRAERIRHLDGLVRQAVPEEHVPAELMERLGLASAPVSAEVVDLSAARRARVETAAAKIVPERRFNLSRLAAQVALVAGLGLAVTLWQNTASERDAPFRTLSNARHSAPANGVVVFAPGTDAAAARAIAGAAGAALVGTPNDAGAWKLAMPAGRRADILASLRRDERVTLAEPIDGQTP